MAVLFDLSDEIQLIDRAPDDWNVEPEHFFYAIRACGMLAVIIPVFEAEQIEKGVRHHGLREASASTRSQIRENSVMTRLASHRRQSDATIAITSSSGRPTTQQSWEGVIRHVFHHERAILQMVDFAGRVRAEWDEYLAHSQRSVGLLKCKHFVSTYRFEALPNAAIPC